MKTIKILSALMFAILLIAALSCTAYATELPPAAGGGTNYTAVSGTSCNFNKYLIMDAGDNVPNVTFSFTVAAGEHIAASANSVEVLAGVGAPTIADVTFAPSDTSSAATDAGTNIDVARAASDRATGLTADTGVQLETGEKYVTKQATVNFSGVQFDEPGIYRYIITETANTTHEAAGIMHDNDVDRVLDVYVTDDNGNLVVSSYVLHKTVGNVAPNATTMGSADVAADGTALDDKTDGFTNEYNSKDLAFAKQVSGNQGSKDKYFRFTVTLGNVADADVFTVSLVADSDDNTTDGSNAQTAPTTNTATTYSTMSNPTSLTGAELKAGVYFYLAHDQSIAIRGIAPNATYSVIEAAEDYQSTASGVTGFTDPTATDATDTDKDTIGDIAGTNKAVKTSYLNTRAGTIPTGVMLTVVPGVVIVMLALGGLVVISRKKKDEA